jgi:hypothetical protein
MRLIDFAVVVYFFEIIFGRPGTLTLRVPNRMALQAFVWNRSFS